MSELFRVLLTIVHLAMSAIWLGSMAYSLTVVQPKIAAFLPNAEDREPLLVLLAHGNRRKVVGLVATLILTGLGISALSGGTLAIGYIAAVLLYGVAAMIFWYVSWRHWPARIFAINGELLGFQRQLRVLATTILALVATAFLIALAVSVSVSLQ